MHALSSFRPSPTVKSDDVNAPLTASLLHRQEGGACWRARAVVPLRCSCCGTQGVGALSFVLPLYFPRWSAFFWAFFSFFCLAVSLGLLDFSILLFGSFFAMWVSF